MRYAQVPVSCDHHVLVGGCLPCWDTNSMFMLMGLDTKYCRALCYALSSVLV